MISTLNDLKKGTNVLVGGEPYVIVEANFVKMQMRKPVMQTKLRNLLNGKTAEYNFHQGERVDEADMQKKKVDYLYNDGDNFYFMAPDTFEQFGIGAEAIGDNKFFLKEGDKVDALYFNDNPVSISLVPKVELKVIAAAGGARGNTAQGRVMQTVTVETGYELQVPQFIKEGDTIRINTETGEYAERAS